MTTHEYQPGSHVGSPSLLRRVRAEASPKLGARRQRTLEIPGANPLKDAHAAPGVPKNYLEAKKLMTGDCVQTGPAGRRLSCAEPPPTPTHPSLTPEQGYGEAAHYYSTWKDAPPRRKK